MKPVVVLTGASSFLGLHLAEAFAGAGWHVIAVLQNSREAYGGVQAERLARMDGRVEFRRLDLRDAENVSAFVASFAPRLWVQHAGYATNYASMSYDLEAAAKVNVAPLRSLYEALAGSGCGMIVTGSSMEYSASDTANKETDGCWPDSPYGLSKLSTTLRARQLALQHGVPTRVARIYIPFGALDDPKKLLMLVSRALRSGSPIDLSPCTQRRDFIAVEDVCAAYLALAADLPRTMFDIFNICSGCPLPLKSLLLTMATAAGRDPALLRFGAIAMRAGEPPISYGDNSKAKSVIGWSARDPEQIIPSLTGALS